MDLSLIHSPDGLIQHIESDARDADYARFVMYIRNTTPEFSYDTICKLQSYITPQNFSTIQRSIGLLQDHIYEGRNPSDPKIIITDELATMIFLAL